MSYVPLYIRVKERIREDFLSVGAGRDIQLPSERELQVRYGVSRPTVSKAMAAIAAEGLLVTSQRRGRFVSPTCDTPDAASRRRLGYVAPVSGETLPARTFLGLDRAAHRRGARVLLGNAGRSVERERAVVHDLIAAGVAGLVVYPVPRRSNEALTDYLAAEDLGVPVVLIDTATPSMGRMQVIFDNRSAGYRMASWLITRGHVRIAFLDFETDVVHGPMIQRFLGYRDALADAGAEIRPDLIGRFSDFEEIGALIDGWLAGSEPPTAIIATEDMAAAEVTDALLARGVRVPEQVQVVGYDNREEVRRFRPSFPTTAPDFERMAEIACEMLMSAIDSGDSPARTYVLEVPLNLRRGVEGPQPSQRRPPQRRMAADEEPPSPHFESLPAAGGI